MRLFAAIAAEGAVRETLVQAQAELRRLGRGKVVSVDLDASLPRLLVYNRVKLLLEGEG